MKKNKQKSNVKKKILVIMAILAVAIIPASFLYSLVMLIIQPSDIFVVEKGQIYNEEETERIHNKRRNST